MHPIIQRLKERKLVQWGVAYLAGAVALYSALDAFAEPWGVGGLQLRIAQVALLVGFFVALTLAWYHGERGEQRVSGVELLILAGIVGLGAIGIRLVTTGPAPSVVASHPRVQRLRMSDLADNHFPLGDFEIGPQGTGLTYPIRSGGGPKWYRGWADLEGQPLVGSEGGANMVSPDGTRMSENSATELRIIPLDGGPVRRRTLSMTQVPTTWGGDGFIYFSGTDFTIHRLAESLLGDVERLDIELLEGESLHRAFQPLPGGDRAVFQVEADPHQIYGYDFETGRRIFLTEGLSPRLTSTGHLVFGTVDGEIMAATLDPETLALGTPVVIIKGQSALVGSGRFLNWSLASDGTLGYWEAREGHRLMWVTRSGASAPVDARWSFDAGPIGQGWALSPDQTRIVYRATVGGDVGIFVRDVANSSERRLTPVDSAAFHYPRWLSDTVVVYGSGPRGTQADVYSVRADGVGDPSLMYDHANGVGRVVPSPNGEWLVIRTSPDRDIVVVRTEGDGDVRGALANPEYSEHGPTISPDGRWLAYSSNELGHDEVSVVPFPNVGGPRTRVSNAGGMSPFWSHDGSELFFVTLDRRMMAVRVSVDPTFRLLSQPEELFVVGPDYIGSTAVQFGHAARDGRFLMMRSETEASLVIVNNWFEELKRLVPN